MRIRLTYAWLYYLLHLFNFDIYLDFGLDTLVNSVSSCVSQMIQNIGFFMSFYILLPEK